MVVRRTEEIADVIGPHAAKDLVGQEVLKGGGKALVGLLEKSGALRETKRIRHSYPYDWRTDEPIIVMCVCRQCVTAAVLKLAFCLQCDVAVVCQH